MARSYKRDKRGRFASTGSGGSKGAGSAGGATNNVRKTNSRLADDDWQSDNRYFKRRNQRLAREIKQNDKEVARLKDQLASMDTAKAVKKRIAEDPAIKAAKQKLDKTKERAAAAQSRLDAVKAKNAAERKARAASLGMTEAQYMAKFAPKPKARKRK